MVDNTDDAATTGGGGNTAGAPGAEVEPPTGTKEVDGAAVSVYTAEQQGRLCVDEFGTTVVGCTPAAAADGGGLSGGTYAAIVMGVLVVVGLVVAAGLFFREQPPPSPPQTTTPTHKNPSFSGGSAHSAGSSSSTKVPYGGVQKGKRSPLYDLHTYATVPEIGDGQQRQVAKRPVLRAKGLYEPADRSRQVNLSSRFSLLFPSFSSSGRFCLLFLFVFLIQI